MQQRQNNFLFRWPSNLPLPYTVSGEGMNEMRYQKAENPTCLLSTKSWINARTWCNVWEVTLQEGSSRFSREKMSDFFGVIEAQWDSKTLGRGKCSTHHTLALQTCNHSGGVLSQPWKEEGIFSASYVQSRENSPGCIAHRTIVRRVIHHMSGNFFLLYFSIKFWHFLMNWFYLCSGMWRMQDSSSYNHSSVVRMADMLIANIDNVCKIYSQIKK